VRSVPGRIAVLSRRARLGSLEGLQLGCPAADGGPLQLQSLPDSDHRCIFHPLLRPQ
jgi:hypothetical protein